MSISNNFSYPDKQWLPRLHQFYGEINGGSSFEPEKKWQGETWSASIQCSRGPVLEKCAFSLVEIVGGSVNEKPASVSLVETLAYPENPCIPGFIIMTNLNKGADQEPMLVFFTDLIMQNGTIAAEHAAIFSRAMKSVCEENDKNFDELQGFATGQGILGNCAAGSGFLYFFTEADAPFLKAVFTAALSAYKKIIISSQQLTPTDEDRTLRNKARARLVDWVLTENFGIKIARENGIPVEVIEAYGFPPAVYY